ncbi:MAG TPA: hypothetical protein VIV60_16130, partial [Polyangiaceae bacterium]
SAANGPFAANEVVTTAENASPRFFGRLLAASGISGTSTIMSVLGNSRADVVVSTLAAASPRLFIVDGTKIAMTGSFAVETLADATVALPPPDGGSWTDFASGLTLIRDADGDGAADIAVGDVSWTNIPVNGRVIVLR